MPAVIVVHCPTHTRTELCPSSRIIRVPFLFSYPYLTYTTHQPFLPRTTRLFQSCVPWLQYLHAVLQKPWSLSQGTSWPCGFRFSWGCSHTDTSTQSSRRNTQTDAGRTHGKALASITDLRLPWLNRERGSCFTHGQKERSEREGMPPP